MQSTRSGFLSLTSVLLLTAFLGGCSEQAESVKDGVQEKVEEIKAEAGFRVQNAVLATMDCEEVVAMSIKGGEGSPVPGVAGAPRWGMPTAATNELQVRRSWSTLSDTDKKKVVDAFLKLKQTTVDSGAPGAERADYETFCPDNARNLYDYYVELHVSAFVSMNSSTMSHTQMAHMGPQFLPWHRYYLQRLEADMREVTGDPDFTMPYWDWEDCEAAGEDGKNPCPAIFDPQFLGSPGSCTDGETTVTGYLADQGFQTHVWTEATAETIFNVDSIRCSAKPLQRRVGCEELVGGTMATAQDVAGIYERKVYDAEPYDTCNTDQAVSFRQYLEGYKNTDTDALCIIAGCENHGRGHVFIGGDMAAGGAPPNDPMFFFHHANIDRLWAQWQDRNRQKAEDAADYGNPAYPDDWRGAIFKFPEVRADELFDFRALGYQYDTQTGE